MKAKITQKSSIRVSTAPNAIFSNISPQKITLYWRFKREISISKISQKLDLLLKAIQFDVDNNCFISIWTYAFSAKRGERRRLPSPFHLFIIFNLKKKMLSVQ